jgi:carboxypeptidase Taq
MSAQFFEAAEAAIPLLSNEIKNGSFGNLKKWLEENLYQHGKKYNGLEVLKRATKRDLTIDPYMRYLKKKYPIK